MKKSLSILFFKKIKRKLKKKDVKYLKNKEVARLFVKDKLKYWNTFYNFKYNRIAIKNQKTRWGSCSIKGNLNFNYKIIFLPEYLADYIIVHELCHLKELNHSKNFWKIVEKTISDYKERIKNLKKIHIKNKNIYLK